MHDGRRFTQRLAITQADVCDLNGPWSCPVCHMDPHGQLTSRHHDPALWSGRWRWWAHRTNMGIARGRFGGSHEVNGPIAVVQHTDSALTSQEAAGQARPVGPPRPHGRRPSSSPPRSFWPWGAIVGDEGALNLSTPTPDTRGTALGRLVGSEAPGWPRSFFGFIGRFSQKSHPRPSSSPVATGCH